MENELQDLLILMRVTPFWRIEVTFHDPSNFGLRGSLRRYSKRHQTLTIQDCVLSFPLRHAVLMWLEIYPPYH